MTSRRKFVQCASATFIGAVFSRGLTAYAQKLNLPLGIQLYSVREQLAKDFEGTLRELGDLGYREVEAAGFYKKSAAEVAQALQKANLKCVSGHYGSPDLHQQLDQIIQFSKEIGAGYIICSSAGKRDASTSGAMTLDDWRWNADEFNAIGQKVSMGGLKFGYHNHVREFAETDGAVPYFELLHRTDPALVTFELDCGWAVVAGQKPVELLRDYSSRISMLHVKDFKIAAGAPAEGKDHAVTELGLGSIDYRPIFQEAAKTQKVKHVFVEQEAFDMPYLESLKVDRDYMRKLLGT
jgi:sugar phosphate isomerase/epimerase